MNRILLGALCALMLVGVGMFWWQGRAEVEQGAPPPLALPAEPSGPEIPVSDADDLTGPAPPEATELTREQRRFFRYDQNRDRIITRNEMLSSRTDAFRKLDQDGNNLLSFEEWAVATATRFDQADRNRNGKLTPEEFATTRPKPAAKPVCRC
ncbi:EF-hand domain-containing protein [Allopontixanthobacter sp.]|uniref:EF-hand domain-containing protein n=1 Tax=Allopontixanthobacter sp. TaxID=2906452 RepID=UPI002ABA8F94|nr:EF-hand domain-containing protein [Allopontixanthobacter sp.]MDZ4306460.1 EF-hand domain-containing protein [Allopontixanthobacter sp.]